MIFAKAKPLLFWAKTTMDNEELRSYFQHDIFASRNGIEIDEIGINSATAHMQVTPQHLNAGGACQGGAIFTLADLAMAVAANQAGLQSVSVDTNIQFLSAGRPDTTLHAKATMLAGHHRLPSFQAIVTDDSGTTIAVATAMFYRKTKEIKH